MAWEKERVELLLELNKQQFSASQIAEKLGGGVTRNAVIGKLNRMGFSCGGGRPVGGSPQGMSQGGVSQGGSPHGISQGGRHHGGTHAKGGRPISIVGGKKLGNGLGAKRVQPQLQPAEEDITIEDLSDSKCRFPMGDPKEKNFRYCGKEKDFDVLPYCDYHTQLAHQRSHRAVVKAERGQKGILERRRKTG